MSAEPQPPSRSRSSSGPDWSAGAVTRLSTPAAPPPPPPPPPTDRGRADRHRLWLFGGAAAAVLAVGLVVVLAMVLSGNPDPFRPNPDPVVDARPPLAKLCPAPTGSPPADPAPADPLPPVSGNRTVDTEAGISYRAYDAPWQPWNAVWSAGTLEVPYKVGQHFVTERQYNGFSDYHASILSAAVPAADNDALSVNIECVGRQVAADVRAEYYPQPNRMELLRDERAVLGGRPAWVTVFRLHFTQPGLQATDELAAVALIDVGRPTAAILYISIPGTHRQYDYMVDDALASVRPL
ncbi:hypothetical protein [Polymorphospora rubra]|uniref:hypothetical protein n=1 Tax=Polymorphospora rubra TaxID=338584 RepID=UPI003403775E